MSSCLLAALAFPAVADTRITSFPAFLHLGPGRQYVVTDEVPARSSVEVAFCRDDWCQIRFRNGAGWIDQRMLAAATPDQPATPVECVDFARTGWPYTGDHERLCLGAPRTP